MPRARAVTRGVIGDELVAAEYLKLWEEEPWGTSIRSTDPVVVETVRTGTRSWCLPRTGHAAAHRGGAISASALSGQRIAYAGICPPVESADLDAAITFSDLEQLFRIRGESRAMPTWFERVPEERRHA